MLGAQSLSAAAVDYSPHLAQHTSPVHYGCVCGVRACVWGGESQRMVQRRVNAWSTHGHNRVNAWNACMLKNWSMHMVNTPFHSGQRFFPCASTGDKFTNHGVVVNRNLTPCGGMEGVYVCDMLAGCVRGA